MYFGITKFGLKTVSGVILILFILRFLNLNQINIKELKYVSMIGAGLGIILISIGYLLNDSIWFKFYPVAMNVLMLGLFASSLWSKQTIVERFARLKESHLSDKAINYTRAVTKVWCIFFVLNGSISLITCFMSLKNWTLYNGFISYILMGTLMAIEFAFRTRQKKNEL